MLVVPSEARYRKNHIDLNDKNDANETRMTLMKKQNYEHKVKGENFNTIALQSVHNNTMKQSTTNPKKGKKAYDELPIESTTGLCL